MCFKAPWGTRNKDPGQGAEGECQGGRVPELGQTQHQRDRAQQEQRAVTQGTWWGCCQAAQVPKTASRRVGCSAMLPGEGVCRYGARCMKGASPALQRLVSHYRSAFGTPPPSYLTFSTKLFSLFHLSFFLLASKKYKKNKNRIYFLFGKPEINQAQRSGDRRLQQRWLFYKEACTLFCELLT